MTSLLGAWRQFSTRLACAAVLVFASAASATAAPAKCGEERWPVKTLADGAGAYVIARDPLEVMLSWLTSLQPPGKSELLAAETKRFPFEYSQYQVRAFVLGFKRETDSDFHIVLGDSSAPKQTMIAEIPSPDCVPQAYRNIFAQLQAQFAAQFGKPAAKFKTLKKPVAVLIRGVLFFDFIHGQTGVAKNGVELHPLLAISKL